MRTKCMIIDNKYKYNWQWFEPDTLSMGSGTHVKDSQFEIKTFISLHMDMILITIHIKNK